MRADDTYIVDKICTLQDLKMRDSLLRNDFFA